MTWYLLAGSIILNAIALRILDSRSEALEINKQPALPDLVHALTPDTLASFGWICDVLLGVVLLIAWYTVGIDGLWEPLTTMFPIILVVRALCYNATLLPNPKKRCETQGWRSFFDSCNDLFFSGHTSLMTLLILIMHQQGVLTTAPAVIGALAYAFMMSAVRNHYTIDVMVGLMTAFSIFMAASNRP